MADLADANYSLSMVRGMRERRKERKAEGEHDVDRANTLERQAKTDEFTDDTRDRARGQWDREDARNAIVDEDQQIKHEQLKQRVEDEGALEFLYEIDAGGDPNQAAARHNQRGRSRMVDGTVKYDHTGKNVEFDMDSDGDGKVEHFNYNVPNTIKQLERVTGKSKDRYMNVPAGGDVLDRTTGKIVASNPKEGAAAAIRPIKQGRYDTILAPDGKTVLRSPARGAGGAAGDAGVTKFNPQTYSKDVTDALGKMLGGKYDPATQQMAMPAGATEKMTVLSRIAQREAMRLVGTHGAITADMIATVVAQQAADFDEKSIRDEVKVALNDVKNSKKTAAEYEGGMLGLGDIKPSVLKQHQNAAVQDALVEIGTRVRTALDAEYVRLGDQNMDPADPELAGETPPETDEVDEGEDPDATAADNQPAVDWPADAPPQEKFRGLQKNTGVRNKRTGDIWFIADDGQLHVKRNGASGQ